MLTNINRLILYSVIAALTATPGLAAHSIWAVTASRNLINFDSDSPGTIKSSAPITNLVEQGNGELVIGIDINPFSSNPFALSSTIGGVYRLYRLNFDGRAVGPVGHQEGVVLTGALSGASFGFDVVPLQFDEDIRVVNEADQNLRYDNSGVLEQSGGALAYAGGDPNAGQNPSIGAIAYALVGPSAGRLYGIDFGLDELVTQVPVEAGTLETIGPLGVDISNIVGFDIARGIGTAYLSSANSQTSSSTLYTIDLSTGATTLVGTIGANEVVLGIAVDPIPEPSAVVLAAIGGALLCQRRQQARQSFLRPSRQTEAFQIDG